MKNPPEPLPRPAIVVFVLLFPARSSTNLSPSVCRVEVWRTLDDAFPGVLTISRIARRSLSLSISVSLDSRDFTATGRFEAFGT